MSYFPNSGAMDATAAGGPITFLPQIVTGSPEQIASHVAQLLRKATHFMSLLDEFGKASDQLGKVWSGHASESALKKISDSLQSFEKIIKVLQDGAELLGVAGTLVKTAQEAYRAVVSAVNPTVASLMSNWWTYGAAVALSTATSASLRAFITAIGALLESLGVAKLGAQISSLVSIIGEIEKLFGGHSSSSPSGGGSVPTVGSVGSTPISGPQAPPPVASSIGQQVGQGQQPYTPPPFTQYTPPALSGGQGGGWPGGQGGSWPGLPTGGQNGSWPGLPGAGGLASGANSGDGWIAVDPAQAATPAQPSTPAGHGAPTDAAGGVGQEVKVTTTHDGVTTTVEVPAGRAADIDLGYTVNGDHFSEHIDITADGRVKVD
ncbi:hypothetical protein F0L68_01620 [Solihabitans fulvus]|uniref:Uncharacterized protein n=1 Tax=Solihabitans fulvus TaxID=1892852 RepID=A0A5B2XUP0_9PSEU|nr:hypothetical protein [Solihabitans fulvus]KAA2266471.1 hypothetical protein F0L68_01620 [Solihabitans fulvus]